MKKQNNLLKNTFKLLSYTGNYKSKYIVVLIICLLSAVLNAVAPFILGLITNSLFDTFTTKSGVNYEYILKLITILIFIYVFLALFSYLKSFLSARIGVSISYNFRKMLIDKINILPLKYIDKQKKGDIISRLTSDITSINDMLSEVIPQLFYNVVLIISSIIMMIFISIELTLMSLLVIPITLVVAGIIVKKTQKYFKLNQKKLGSVNAFIEESVTNMLIIKSFNKEEYFNNKFDKENNELKKYSFKSIFYSGIIMPITKFIGNLNYILVVGLGAKYVINGLLKVGAIQSFIQYNRDFGRTISNTTQMLSIVQTASSAADRIFEILETKKEKEGKLEEVKFDKNISFDNITFEYTENTPVLKNFILDIKKGEQIAIVGETGAGKTTIVNLLMNFYKINKGVIKIDGVDINKYSQKALREKISMVLQDSWVFKGTIKDNILFDKKISDKELSEILLESKLDHIVESLPGGIDYVINEEVTNISEGEKQLITIARAIAYNPSILILDEATSSVDSRIEYLLHSSMKNLMKNKTSLVIAHRLSTIVNSDRIIVLNHGKIMESGTHEELLKNKKHYYKLYNSQFENKE